MPTHWIVFACIAVVVIYAIVVFNRLIRARNLVREGWSGIDVQLRRRNDLIPNLVETVKAYAAHERGLFEDIAAKRTASLSGNGVQAKAAVEGDLQGSLGRLLAVAEAYPELKANENFLKLQEELAETEDQLQMARRYYNGTVRDFNIAVRTIPDVLIATMAGMREEPFFETDAASKALPQVSVA